MQGRIWTFSNALSFLRVLLIVPVVVLIWNDGDRLTLGVLVFLAGLTDLLDGMLARALHQETEFGKLIDPIADKLCIAVVGFVLMMKGLLPLWFILFAIVRDAAILIGGTHVKRTKGIILQSNFAGKWASAIISFFVLTLVLRMPELEWLSRAFLIIATVLLGLSSAQYLNRFRRVMSEQVPSSSST
jgi:CDP-diacylglycerol--glycerol-3-phosphate 3-phosphatidyltransferase